VPALRGKPPEPERGALVSISPTLLLARDRLPILTQYFIGLRLRRAIKRVGERERVPPSKWDAMKAQWAAESDEDERLARKELDLDEVAKILGPRNMWSEETFQAGWRLSHLAIAAGQILAMGFAKGRRLSRQEREIKILEYSRSFISGWASGRGLMSEGEANH
jgi:hypothetical protein